MIAYARKDKGAKAALIKCFADQKKWGMWTAYHAAKKMVANEQTTASHDQLWQQWPVAALWIALERGDDDIADEGDLWMQGYTAINCAAETPNGHVVLPGKRTFAGHYWSSYRDDTHRVLRGFEEPTHGPDWPRDRSVIGPCLVRNMLKNGHRFRWAVDLNPDNCSTAFPHVVEKLVIERWANGHIASMPDAQWLSPKDDTRTAWWFGGKEGYDTEPPPVEERGEMLMHLEVV